MSEHCLAEIRSMIPKMKSFLEKNQMSEIMREHFFESFRNILESYRKTIEKYPDEKSQLESEIQVVEDFINAQITNDTEASESCATSEMEYTYFSI